LGKMKNNIQY